MLWGNGFNISINGSISRLHALGMASTARSMALCQGSSTLRMMCHFPSHSGHPVISVNTRQHIQSSSQLTNSLSLHCFTIWQHNDAFFSSPWLTSSAHIKPTTIHSELGSIMAFWHKCPTTDLSQAHLLL
eukprot:Gb_14378 [translate_table: standard]